MDNTNIPPELQEFFDKKQQLLIKRKKLTEKLKKRKRYVITFLIFGVIAFLLNQVFLLVLLSIFVIIPYTIFTLVLLPITHSKLNHVTSALESLGVDYENAVVNLDDKTIVSSSYMDNMYSPDAYSTLEARSIFDSWYDDDTFDTNTNCGGDDDGCDSGWDCGSDDGDCDGDD